MPQKKRRPMQDELTEAMHSEFTVDDETATRHRVWTARESVALGLNTPEEAAEVYNVPLELLTAPDPE